MDDRLAPFIGDWTVKAPFTDTPGRAEFTWLLDGRFVFQRFVVPHPEAPDSVSILGYEDEGYVQHYFDTRGVVRRYEMSIANGVWKLWREQPGFSQRWQGTFSDDGDTITGAWELNRDGTWEKDFDLTYTRVR